MGSFDNQQKKLIKNYKQYIQWKALILPERMRYVLI